MDANEKFRPNLLQAMRYLKIAWESVHSATIRNAFVQARFFLDEEVLFYSHFLSFLGAFGRSSGRGPSLRRDRESMAGFETARSS